MPDSTAQAAGPQERVTDEDRRWLEGLLSIADTQSAEFEYDHHGTGYRTPQAQRAFAEAERIRRILAALSSSPATQPEPVAYLVEWEGKRTAMLQKPFEPNHYSITPLYEVVPTPQAVGRPTYEELAATAEGLEREAAWLRNELRGTRDMVNGDFWFWQGDGEDHLESLVCPVVIQPDALRALLSRIPKAEPLNNHGWIECQQEMPKSGRFVLAFYKNLHGHGRTVRAMWAAPRTLELDPESDYESAEYDEEKDTYYCPKGWYEANENEESHWRITETVAHWQPLPAPPEP